MTNNDDGLSSGLLFFGFITGLIVGSIAALFKAPRNADQMRQQISESGDALRNKIESAVSAADPLSESLAEGKAAAQRRRAELGLNRNN